MENESHEPSALALPATIRHDGWTGEKMAVFCETLAETAVVAEACDQAHMGIPGAYALRRRNPVFAAAWDAALTIARERLADTLLARSMEGNIEQVWRGGECVGERHVLDNRLGLAILRRLDRLAETGCTVSSRGERFVTHNRHPRLAPDCHPRSFDWELAVAALRTGDDTAVATALALAKGNEVEEVEDPPISLSQGDTEDEGVDLSARCWWSDVDEAWMTDFPPPADFDGYESCVYGDPDQDYERACTTGEAAALEASKAAGLADERAEDEQLRDSWFDAMRADLAGGSAGPPASGPESTRSPAQPGERMHARPEA